jgi:hypothetical protein
MEHNKRRVLRLPEFWVRDPVAWFAHVEAHFELENLESQQHHYFNIVKSLSQDSLRLIKDILANPHPTTPYEVLKDRLLNNHSLTDFQKIERPFKIGELGPQQKPLELLAHMVELTPADELESKYLIFLFIQRLPKILQNAAGGQPRPGPSRPSRRFRESGPPVVHLRPTSRRMGRVAGLASLWLPSPPSTRRSSNTSTPAAVVTAPRVATPPRPPT